MTYELDTYLTDPAWMYRQSNEGLYGTHGLGHITRVLVWSAHIADQFDRPLRRAELLWAAALHDVERWDDGLDRNHGERSARWVLERFPVLRPEIAGRLDLSLIASICRGHVLSDEQIDEWSDELLVLKDADGLERVRICDLDASRLRLRTISPALEKKAWTLMRVSSDSGNTVESVRSAAVKLELWR